MSQSAKKLERQEAIERLREWLKPGDTVYTILRHVSRSGMRREISLVQVEQVTGSTIRHLDVAAAKAMGNRIGKQGIIIDGAGMDMGFDLVYSLGRTLWPAGVGARCAKCGRRPCHTEDDGKIVPNKDANGDLYCYGPCSGWNRDTEPEGEYFGHEFSGRNGDTGPWEPDGGYALAQRWL